MSVPFSEALWSVQNVIVLWLFMVANKPENTSVAFKLSWYTKHVFIWEGWIRLGLINTVWLVEDGCWFRALLLWGNSIMTCAFECVLTATVSKHSCISAFFSLLTYVLIEAYSVGVFLSFLIWQIWSLLISSLVVHDNRCHAFQLHETCDW